MWRLWLLLLLRSSWECALCRQATLWHALQSLGQWPAPHGVKRREIGADHCPKLYEVRDCIVIG